MNATKISNVNVSSYVRKHTLWQAIADGSTICLHANIDRSITVNLVVGGKTVASERPGFRTIKAQTSAMEYAAASGRLEIVAGAVVGR